MSDRRLANHIVSLYGNEPVMSEVTENLISRDFLSKYISYARKYMNPVISEGAVDTLTSAYAKMRSMGNSYKTITATPR